jgi:hypothetical protein
MTSFNTIGYFFIESYEYYYTQSLGIRSGKDVSSIVDSCSVDIVSHRFDEIFLSEPFGELFGSVFVDQLHGYKSYINLADFKLNIFVDFTLGEEL